MIIDLSKPLNDKMIIKRIIKVLKNYNTNYFDQNNFAYFLFSNALSF